MERVLSLTTVSLIASAIASSATASLPFCQPVQASVISAKIGNLITNTSSATSSGLAAPQLRLSQPQRQPLLLLAKKKKKEPVQTVKVTTVKLVSEDIVGTPLHTLIGEIVNNTEAPVGNVVVYYEVYAPATNKLVDAGSIVATPSVIASQGAGQFTASPKAGGNVKITLVEWGGSNRSYGSYSQMQVFP
jgi:hypothetical protein